MNEFKRWYEKYHIFNGPLIMEGKQFWEYKDNLMKQIEELISTDTGLAQPCHCESHDPDQCKKDEEMFRKDRDDLAANIKKALMLS